MHATEAAVWYVAKVLVANCREDALKLASMTADELLVEGDLDGRAAWLRVKCAVEELLARTTPLQALH